MENHVEFRLTFGSRTASIEAQTTEHIFHVDNCIINQRTDRNGHTTDTHRIDRQPHDLQHEQCDHQ